MQARKRLEEAITNDDRIRGMTDDLDTLFELAREGEAVVPGYRARSQALCRVPRAPRDRHAPFG